MPRFAICSTACIMYHTKEHGCSAQDALSFFRTLTSGTTTVALSRRILDANCHTRDYLGDTQHAEVFSIPFPTLNTVQTLAIGHRCVSLEQICLDTAESSCMLLLAFSLLSELLYSDLVCESCSYNITRLEAAPDYCTKSAET